MINDFIKVKHDNNISVLAIIMIVDGDDIPI